MNPTTLNHTATTFQRDNRMKAIVYTQYGSPDVLHQAEVPKPIPRENEVLIKVYAVGLNAADWRMMRADPFFVRFFAGMLKPKNQILGADIAGTVEAVGSNVKRLQPGDAVYGDLSGDGMGGLAEYVCAPEESIAPKPMPLSFKEAATVPMAAMAALQGLRDHGQIQSGQKVLIHGASGGVGSFAVQIAKALGGIVTAVCSTSKMDQARLLGADHVLDYTKEDFAQNGETYDLILAANGDRSLSDYLGALTPTGRYIMAGGSMKQMFQAILLGSLKSKKDGKTIKDFTAKPKQADLNFITELIEAGKIKPILDKQYPFSETPDAMRYLDQGHAKGKIIVTVSET
ncbi:MAG: NAD(P)-dependent alcohol dehydrogenase [Chloroflexota bacterium]